jgi:hypothetical protein
MHDYGFDLPDIRHRFICKDEDEVKVIIVRHWYLDDDSGEINFKVSFDIVKGKIVTSLPIGVDESIAVDISHKLYVEDEESTKEIREIDAMYEAERRVGA